MQQSQLKMLWPMIVLAAADEGAGGGGEPAPSGAAGSGGTGEPGGAPEAAPAAAGAAPPPAPAPDLSFLGESFIKDGTLDAESFKTHYTEMQADLARRVEAEGALPTKPEDYQVSGEIIQVPDEWQEFLPEGWKPEYDANDPVLKSFLDVAAKHRLPQEVVNELLQLDAQRDFEAFKTAQQNTAAEMKALGPSADARRQAIVTKMKAMGVPDARTDALIGSLNTADAVRALEAILSATNDPRAAGGAPSAPREFATPYERLQYANAEAARTNRQSRR